MGAVGFETINTRTIRRLADSGATERSATDAWGTVSEQELDREQRLYALARAYGCDVRKPRGFYGLKA